MAFERKKCSHPISGSLKAGPPRTDRDSNPPVCSEYVCQRIRVRARVEEKIWAAFNHSLFAHSLSIAIEIPCPRPYQHESISTWIYLLPGKLSSATTAKTKKQRGWKQTTQSLSVRMSPSCTRCSINIWPTSSLCCRSSFASNTETEHSHHNHTVTDNCRIFMIDVAEEQNKINLVWWRFWFSDMRICLIAPYENTCENTIIGTRIELRRFNSIMQCSVRGVIYPTFFDLRKLLACVQGGLLENDWVVQWPQWSWEC